jgi:hypothetical protein
VKRGNRRADSAALTDAIGAPDEAIEEATEDAVEGRRRKVWRKMPDESLARKLARRGGEVDPLPFDTSERGWH